MVDYQGEEAYRSIGYYRIKAADQLQDRMKMQQAKDQNSWFSTSTDDGKGRWWIYGNGERQSFLYQIGCELV